MILVGTIVYFHNLCIALRELAIPRVIISGAGKGKAGEQGKDNSIAELAMSAVTLDFFSVFGFQNLLQMIFLTEMSAGLTEENSDNENDDSAEDQDLDRHSMNPPVRREDKKTVTQRNKE